MIWLLSELKFFAFNTLCSPCDTYLLAVCLAPKAYSFRTNSYRFLHVFNLFYISSSPSNTSNCYGTFVFGIANSSSRSKGIRCATRAALVSVPARGRYASLCFASLWGTGQSLRSLHSAMFYLMCYVCYIYIFISHVSSRLDINLISTPPLKGVCVHVL